MAEQIFDIDGNDVIKFNPNVIALCLEHFGIINPKNLEKSQVNKFREQIETV